MFELQITDTELEERFSSLTRREIHLLRDAAAGYASSTIAERNQIATSTVNRHMANIYKKLYGAQRSKSNTRNSRVLSISLLQRHDALQVQKAERDNIRIQDPLINHWSERSISLEDLVDLILACFQKNVEELTLRVGPLRVKALKMKGKDERECIVLIVED